MTLREKIQRLKRLSDLALYRWTAGKHRISDKNFILLSDLRLNVLTCAGGTLQFSSAAPLLLMEHGRPYIQFRDNNVLTILDGPRKGINIMPSMLHDGEQAAPARHCECRVINEDDCPKWLEDKIMTMANSPCYPVTQLRMPELFRISRKPRTLNPIFTAELIREIGGTKGDDIQTLREKFYANLDLFGYYTDEGYVISNDRICSGGCCVVASHGITMRTGSAMHMMTLTAFIAECERRKWSIGNDNTIKDSGEEQG